MENIQFFMVVQRKQAIGGTGFLPSTVSLIFLGTNFGNISQIVRPGKHQFLPVFWVFEGCFSAEDNHLHEAKRRQTDYTLSGPRILILIYLYSLYIFIYSCILYIIYNCTCMICIYIYTIFSFWRTFLHVNKMDLAVFAGRRRRQLPKWRWKGSQNRR